MVAAVPGEGTEVVVVEGVGDDELGGVQAAALHLLPRRATLAATAPVVTPAWPRTYKKPELSLSHTRKPSTHLG